MADVNGFITSLLQGGQFALLAYALVKVWPLVKAKINEGRKIELDADADLRGDLLERIKELETSRDGEPARTEAALAAERRRCDSEIAGLKLEFNRRIDQLMRLISQDSQSTARLLDDRGKLGQGGDNQ